MKLRLRHLRFLAFFLAFLLLTQLLTGCALFGKKKETPAYFTLTGPGDSAMLHTDLQAKYLAGGYGAIKDYANGTSELSRPVTVQLKWELTEAATELGINRCTVKVSENADLSEAKEYTTTAQSVRITNLKIGTVYYWSVSATVGEETYASEIASFRTDATAPRNLSVGGITNVRDIGGWKRADGSTVKQGMIYRCGRLSANRTGKKEITDMGIDVMLDELGIRSDIDLRELDEAGITKSPLGSDVRYYACPMIASNGIMTNPDNADEIAAVFHVLADESNYPLIFHCSIGTDRTGAIAFLINALLGVEKESLYRDYLFSNFGDIGGSRDAKTIDNYLKAVNECTGKDLSEKTYQYLCGIGVPKTDLDAFLAIMG